MKNGFEMHETANSEAAQQVFDKSAAIFGWVPNLFRVLVESPAAGNALAAMYPMADDTSLSSIEQQIVYQAVNVANECHYCVPAHTMVSRMVEMPDRHIARLRAGEPLDDPKLEALRAFTVSMTTKRGDVSGTQFNTFLAAGWTRQTALDIVMLIAIKTITNYTNHLSGTPLDEQFAKEAWDPAAASV